MSAMQSPRQKSRDYPCHPGSALEACLYEGSAGRRMVIQKVSRSRVGVTRITASNFFKTFFSLFDESPKSGIYCKAPLNTAAIHRKAKEDRGRRSKSSAKRSNKKYDFLTAQQKLMYTTRLS
jgi:hypothetical protein